MHTLTRRGTAPLCAIIAAIALIACGEETGSGSSVPQVMEVTAEDAGTTVELVTKDEVVITLDSNVTTGFAWTLARAPDPEVLELVDTTYVEPETELVGAGGQEVWTFRAAGTGSTDLELSYERPSGETAGEPFTLNVVVSA
jgi:inhibitor of cysteine peptidase